MIKPDERFKKPVSNSRENSGPGLNASIKKNNSKKSDEQVMNKKKDVYQENKIINLNEQDNECKQWQSDRNLECIVDHGWGEFHRDPA